MKTFEPFCAVEYRSSKGPIRRYRLEGDELRKVTVENTGYFTSVKQFFRVRDVREQTTSLYLHSGYL